MNKTVFVVILSTREKTLDGREGAGVGGERGGIEESQTDWIELLNLKTSDSLHSLSLFFDNLGG